jgi:DNA-binding beta-propeller fold protein YncE
MSAPAVVQPAQLARTRRYHTVRAMTAAVVAAGLATGVLALGVAPALAVPAHVLSPSFGSAGSGPGQLELAPSSEVAVDQATGDIYVADTGNRRVDEFSPSGAFILAFGENVGGAGVDVCTTSCVKGTSSKAPGAFEQPLLIAVDNSTGPSKGDIYVGDVGDDLISKFTEADGLVKSWADEGQQGGFTSEEGTLTGIAVEPNGGLFAVSTNQFTFWFNQNGKPEAPSFFTINVNPPSLAVDTELDLYELRRGLVLKFTNTGTRLGGEFAGEQRAVGLAIDMSDNDLYLTQHAETGEGGDVQRFSPACDMECTATEEFGFEIGELKAPQGLAVNSTSHTVYVADSSANQINVFTEADVAAPTVGAPIVSEASYTTAKVSGTIDPNGHNTTCRFEYVTDAQFTAGKFAEARSAPCVANPGAGSSPVAVEAELTGLHASTKYHVRLTGENRGIPGNTTHSGEPSPTFETLVVGPPTITIEPPTLILPTSAHFAGHIDPNAPAGDPPAFDVRWQFECSPACPGVSGGTLLADNVDHEVSTSATGLEPGREYKVTLVGTNAGGSTNALNGPLSFTTPAVAPSVISSSVVSAAGSEATLSSEVDPGGAPTTYHYEYITEAQYLSNGETFQGAEKTAESAPVGEAGDNKDHEAQATLTGLTANTNYRFRVVAQNDIETVDGPSELLYSYSRQVFGPCAANEHLREENNSLLLPDCRAYEQVSPAESAEAFIPEGQNFAEEGFDDSGYPMQAAAGGSAVSYVAEPAGSGACEGTGNAGGGEGDEYLAVRGVDGWSSCDIQPLGSSAETSYQAFSGNLSHGLIRTGQSEVLASGVAGHCGLLYGRRNEEGAFTALFTPEAGEVCDGNEPAFFVGASSDYSQLAFESKAALAPGAVKSNEALGHENVYDSAAGQVRLVNVLPGASPVAIAGASIGALSGEPNIPVNGADFPAIDASNAIASDGSVIFWTNLTGARDIVYARENPSQEQSEIAGGKCTEPEKACTLQVSEGAATYQTATPDGRYAYYSEAGELYRFDTQTRERTALTAAGAEVQGVIGVNQSGQDGAYLYFVAGGKLAAGAEARKCEAAPEGPLRGEEELGLAPAGYGCNLYLIHAGATSLAAVLSASDDEFKGSTVSLGAPKGDWRPVLGYRSAELSADGRSLVFMSNRQLTGYQNVNRHDECSPGNTNATHSCAEIYLYNAEEQSIACASCAPSGAPPIKADESAKAEPNIKGSATYLPGDFGSITHMRRLISADGSRVFFDSDQPLVPQDKNDTQDVYEWEREGTGSCTGGSASNGGGCVYLLSGGASGSSGSYLLDADETGDNAFFVSRTAFVPGGGDGEKPNVFDARVNGGFKGAPGAIIQPPECKTAEECKEPQGEQPVESFPASAAFSGAGNLIAPLEATKPPAEKPAPRKLTRAQQLAKALKACRKQAKRKRAGCVKQAQRRYGPIKKQAKKKGKR